MTTPPEEIRHVSQSQFSVARFAGGCRFNGQSYTYDPTTDTLIRDDVLKERVKAERAKRKPTPKPAPDLFPNPKGSDQ